MNTFNQNYYRNYLAKQFSYPHLFCIFIFYLIVALPFYFSFGGQNFWLNSKQQLVTCDYNFTGNYAIQVNYVSGSAASSNQQYSSIVGYPTNNLTLNSFSVSDQLTLSTFQISVNGYSGKEIISTNIILYYDIYVYQIGKSLSVAVMQTISGNQQYISRSGFMSYSPQSPLNAIQTQIILNSPAYYPKMISPTSFSSLLDQIVQNSDVHRLQTKTNDVSVKGQAGTRLFKLSYIKDRSVVVSYYPSILETLKFSYARIFAFIIIAYLIFWNLLVKLIKDRALQTTIVDEIIR